MDKNRSCVHYLEKMERAGCECNGSWNVISETSSSIQVWCSPNAHFVLYNSSKSNKCYVKKILYLVLVLPLGCEIIISGSLWVRSLCILHSSPQDCARGYFKRAFVVKTLLKLMMLWKLQVSCHLSTPTSPLISWHTVYQHLSEKVGIWSSLDVSLCVHTFKAYTVSRAGRVGDEWPEQPSIVWL